MEKELSQTKRNSLKALVAILGLLIVALLVYIFGLPLYPELKYRFFMEKQNQAVSQVSDAEKNNEPNQVAISSLPAAQTREGNFLIIPKIGVDIPIVDSQNSDWALNRGAWRMPETSTPPAGGNMAIAGHRFKYLPPSNLTFYLLDKLVVGDMLEVFWAQKEYYYKVTETKIVLPTDVSVLAPTEKTTLTLITCDPIFSQKNRLIVIGELVK